MELGIIQITNNNSKRQRKLIEDGIIQKCIEVSKGNYTLVSPPNSDLKSYVEKSGGMFSEFTAWDRDMSRKWRQGITTRKEEWLAFFADDVYPDDNWHGEMSNYLSKAPPGQYGFRLTDLQNTRHEFGEDWMQFPNARLGLKHRPLAYNIETGEIEQSPMAYVANCIVHRDVLEIIEPYGIYGAAPDVAWSLAIRACGYPIGFNPKAKCYHIGDREDNRK
jgi:GT2 family glycosyltransferase